MAHIDSYGVLLSRPAGGRAELVVEEIETLGYSVVEGLVPPELVAECRGEGVKLLKQNDESSDPDIVRAPWAQDRSYLAFAQIPLVHEVLDALIPGRHVLTQQNLVRNPRKGKPYSQVRFHRDLPYQHFVASRPLAINVLVCLDDWTSYNGATQVLPASHKEERFPSLEFAKRHAVTVEAPRGSVIIMHAMTYHAGGLNTTLEDRIGINQIFSSPMIRTQLNHDEIVSKDLLQRLTSTEIDLLDVEFRKVANEGR